MGRLYVPAQRRHCEICPLYGNIDSQDKDISGLPQMRETADLESEAMVQMTLPGVWSSTFCHFSLPGGDASAMVRPTKGGSTSDHWTQVRALLHAGKNLYHTMGGPPVTFISLRSGAVPIRPLASAHV